MKVIKPYFKILDNPDGKKILKHLEKVGRSCYKSEDRITKTSYKNFIKGIIVRGHESILEHASISVKVVCNRSISHQLCRHRIAAYAQESQRFCKYDTEITVIQPLYFKKGSLPYKIWWSTCQKTEEAYKLLRTLGQSPQEARSVLPNSMKTEIIISMNLRSWRHFFETRYFGTTGRPDPQMIEITKPLYNKFRKLIPIVFDDLELK
jgi:thymidylate synthase (FAD)